MRDAEQPGRVIGLKVEYEDPDTPESLALRLAEHFTGQSTRGADASAFRAQAVAERTKAASLTELLFRIKERDRARARGEAVDSGRRMDAFAEYDRDAVEEELRTLKEHATEMDRLAGEAEAAATRHAAKATSVQRKLVELRKKK